MDVTTGLSSPAFTGNGQVGVPFRAGIGWNPEFLRALQLNAGYLTTGPMRDTTGGPKLIFIGGVSTLGYRLDLDPVGKTHAIVRAGWYEGRSEVRARDTLPRGDITGARGLTAGVAFENRFGPWVGLRLGLDALFNVPDFSGPNEELKGDGSSDYMLITVGVVFGTGEPELIAEHEKAVEARRERRAKIIAQRQAVLEVKQAAALADAREREAAAEVARASALADAREREAAAARTIEQIRMRERAAASAATASASPPPPAVAAATTHVPPAVPPALAAGQPARLRPGAFARARATPEGDAVTGLDAGVAVTLKVMLRNNTGVWWYVFTPDAAGWVRDADLEPVTP